MVVTKIITTKTATRIKAIKITTLAIIIPIIMITTLTIIIPIITIKISILIVISMLTIKISIIIMITISSSSTTTTTTTTTTTIIIIIIAIAIIISKKKLNMFNNLQPQACDSNFMIMCVKIRNSKMKLRINKDNQDSSKVETLNTNKIVVQTKVCRVPHSVKDPQKYRSQTMMIAKSQIKWNTPQQQKMKKIIKQQ